MCKTENIRALSADEQAALERFALANGRTWKSILKGIYWYNARPWRGPGSEPSDGGILHALRNDPNWSFHGLDACRINLKALRDKQANEVVRRAFGGAAP